MGDHQVDRLLPEWGAWLRRENAGALGYAQVRYREMVARASSASDVPSVDPDVPRLDAIVRKHMAGVAVQMLRLRYEHGLPDKTSAKHLRMSRSEFNRMLNLIVLPQLRLQWDVYGQFPASVEVSVPAL